MGLAIVSPWAVGGAPAWVIRALTLISLMTSFVVLVVQVRAKAATAPPESFWPLFGLLALGALQLVPLPPLLHRTLAPGSAELWHPEETAAAVVLGGGWRPVSVHPAVTRAAVAWGFGLLSLTSLALPALKDRHRRRRAIAIVVGGGLGVAIYGVLARIAFGPLLFGQWPVPTVTPFGPFVSKNHFAGYVAMCALLGLGLAFSLADSRRREASPMSWIGGPRAGRALVAFGVVVTLALSVLVSQSRGGTLALAVGTAAFFLLRAQDRTARRGRVAAVVVLVVLAALLWVLPEDARKRLVGLSGPPDASGAYRLALWQDALTAFRASPLVGQGLGAFEDALPRYKSAAGELRVEHAENEGLELLVEGGLLAGILAGLTLVLATRKVLAGRRDHGQGPTSEVVAGAAAGLATLLTHSLFDFNLRLAAGATLAAVLVACVSVGSPAAPFRGVTRVGVTGQLALLACSLLIALAPLQTATESSPEIRSTLAAVQPGPVRVRWTEVAAVELLRRRPADAGGWALLGWLRALEGDSSTAAALTRYASALDPQRSPLRSYAERIRRSKVSPGEAGRGTPP